MEGGAHFRFSSFFGVFFNHQYNTFLVITLFFLCPEIHRCGIRPLMDVVPRDVKAEMVLAR